MKEFINENMDIRFEMSHEEVDALIKDFKEKKIKINSHDIARIHAHISPSGENCTMCHKNVIDAGIVIDFNKEFEDEA